MSQEYIEVTEKTKEDAITTACRKLSVTSDRLDYVVVQEATNGFLGFNAKPCILKARIKESSAKTEAILKDVLNKANSRISGDPEEAEKAAKQAVGMIRTEVKSVSTASGLVTQEALEEAKKRNEEAVKEREAAREKAAAEAAEKKAQAEKAAAEAAAKREAERAARKEAGEEEPRRERRGDRRRDRNRGRDRDFGKNRNRDRRMEEIEVPADVKPSVPEEREKVAPEKQLSDEKIAEITAAAENFLTDVFGAMNMNVEKSFHFDKEWNVFSINLSGDDMGLLIGKRGQTLDSLQYLISLVVNKKTEDYIHIKCDTENYRERRKETLESLARNVAYKVKRSRRPMALEPMNPYERRIIHSALQGDRYVMTYSEGEEPYRKVIVAMKNDRKSRED